ncbi:hypothetical protein QJS10_CPB15g00938 [Acorus calamus]|uniref:S1-like domain-containing protein n=1 Tax=Acorus calamus TaxID=4465 RepID=A0AAV9D5X6_ACOCL|nr:hypothetical protein QJS10_CPB15g00938 [Acorus calamus]
MRAGRKNLKKAVEEGDSLSLSEGQTIMQVVSLRGSNVIEVMDAQSVKSLAIFPAKFQRSFWIKRGNFVVVDGGSREKALESGCKVTCIVSQVLFHEQVRVFQKSPNWPEVFRATKADATINKPHITISNLEEDSNLSEDEDDNALPPLEPNTNRIRPVELDTHTDSDSDSSS